MFERRHLLRDTVESLLSQADEIHVYLNDYPDTFDTDGWPPSVTFHWGQDYGDMGKFAALGGVNTEIVVTCDDDLVFNQNFVVRSLAALFAWGDKTAISLHGSIVRNPQKPYYDKRARKILSFAEPRVRSLKADIVGTGCLATWRSNLEGFDYQAAVLNTADISFSAWALERGCTLVVRAHGSNEIVQLQVPKSISDSSVAGDGSDYDMSHKADLVFREHDWLRLRPRHRDKFTSI